MHFFYLCCDVSEEVFTEHEIVASFLSGILIIFIVVPSSKLSYCLNSLKEVSFFVHKYSFFPSRTSKRKKIFKRSVSFHKYPERVRLYYLVPGNLAAFLFNSDLYPLEITSWMLALDSVIHYILSQSFSK